MNAKKTTEGHIFHFSGETEHGLIWRLFSSVPEDDRLANVILGRLAEGGGEAFCIFDSEVKEFEDLLGRARERLTGGEESVDAVVLALSDAMSASLKKSN